jgi:hypothetical protein
MHRREFLQGVFTAGVLARAAVFLPVPQPKSRTYIDDIDPNYAAFRHALKTLCEQHSSGISWVSLDPLEDGSRLARVYMRDNTVIRFHMPWRCE